MKIITKGLFEVRLKELVLWGLKGRLPVDVMIGIMEEEAFNLLIAKSELEVVDHREIELKEMVKRTKRWDRELDKMEARQ